MTGALTSSGLFGQVLSDPQVAEAFSASRFLAHMLAFERAWTKALGKTGSVSRANADAALAVIDLFEPDLAALAAGSNRDGLPVPALIRTLKGAAGDAADAIHTGATSQDVIDTAMVLALREVAWILDARLAEALATLSDLRTAYGNRMMMGRTRMQAALPLPVFARLEIWSRPLAAARTRLAEIAKALPVHVGGAVGLRDQPEGTGDQMAKLVARELGLPDAPVWHSARAPVAEYGHALMMVAGALGKMGQDIALMAQQGVDEIQLSGGGGSSAMPHKQNPIIAEAIVTLARYVAGQQGILGQAMIHEQERSGTAWALEWLVLPAMAEATGAATRHSSDVLSQIERIGQPTE
ncbi:MAG: 3-carboxy-cis,cis-muconate cycloisomerase [Paracoccaceae bacterium]